MLSNANRRFFHNQAPEKNGNHNGNGKGSKPQLKSDCGNRVFPMGLCSNVSCGQFLESQGHHSDGVPEWVRKRFKKYFGIILTEAKKVFVCPRCHKKMEKNRHNFQAVVMSLYVEQLTEIDEAILNGRETNYTYEELLALAMRNYSVGSVANKQPASQEVVLQTQN